MGLDGALALDCMSRQLCLRILVQWAGWNAVLFVSVALVLAFDQRWVR